MIAFNSAADGSDPNYEQVRVSGPRGLIVKGDGANPTVTGPKAGWIPLALTWV